MSGRDFIRLIEKAITDDESSDDVATMIDLLAEARSEAREVSVEGEYRAAGKILCVIFDPLKPPRYRERIAAVRHAFIGISDDEDLQEEFSQSLTDVVLTGTLTKIFATHIDRLFSVDPGKHPERPKARA